jgi:phospholipid:diacylglycerol acyltransferase
MAKPATGAVRRRGRKVDDNEPADEPSSRGNAKNAASGASAPGASKGKKRDAAPKKPAKDGGRVVSRTKRQSAKARVDLVKRLAAFVCVACLAVYLRAIPMGAIPEAFQDRVEHAMPHWLNSSMHLLNGLPALNTTAFNGNGRRGSPSPGAQARAAGRKPHHPVVIVPGFISSGLELWEGHDCGRHFFRQRMWGTPAMARAYFADRACWMQHMRLDPKTGLDPSGIKLRAVTGLEAVDWFVPGYFVWGKVIESLGDVGYDPNSIHAATFDWRLSPEQLERRDGYFTRLKHSVETLVEIHGVPVALLAHSYGDQLVRYFLNWVETTKAEGGGGGPDWTSRHVGVYVDIAGPMLGIPKTIPSLLSGEMRDTAILGQLESVLGLGQNPLGGLVAGTLGTVATTFRTWGSLWAMLPRGGVDIWGADDALGAPDDVTRAPDETSAAEVFFRANETEEARDEKSARHFRAVRASPLRHFLSVREETEDEAAWDRDRDRDPDPNDGANDAGRVSEEARVEKLSEKLSVTASARLLFDRVGAEHPANLREYRDVILGSDGVDAAKTKKNMSSATRFGDPLVSPLPRAPGLQIFCAYGVGKPTERAYHYVRRSGPASAERPYALDVKATRNAEDVDKGVALTDGDGSIPLVSLGYVCAEAWRARGAKFGKKNASDAFVTRLNPGGAVVKIREYPHRALGVWNGGLQEGPGSGDHVNIMGNHEMIRDVVEAVTGHGGEIEERVHSGVFELAANVERLREAREKKSQTRPEPGGGRDEL